MPFTKEFRKSISHHIDMKFLSCLRAQDGRLEFSTNDELKKEYAEYMEYKDHIFVMNFTSVDEYLGQLEEVAVAIRTFFAVPQHAMLYLAAAVSDFYIPKSKMPMHKIQSGDTLSLSLDPVPKMLGRLVNEWAPSSFVVSFKLETDETLLVEKATCAIERYGVHSVVANQLQTRRDVVRLVDGPVLLRNHSINGGCAVSVLYRPENESYIEGLLVSEIISRHKIFVEAAHT